MRSANVRADAIVFNSALSAYAHTRPPLWKPARQLPNAAAARHATHYVVVQRSLHASAERPGRHGGSLAAADELWPALLDEARATEA
jgi:hypothetical protein